MGDRIYSYLPYYFIMSVSESVLKIAAHSFGEDNVELIDGDTRLLIKAGDVEISNEQGLTHMLKGVWVKVHITTANFYICRNIVTQKEYQHNYCHSHRSRDAHIGEFKSCCLGSGPIISTISALNLDNSREDLWVVYFMQLKEYLATESLAGGPYFKIYDLSRPPYTNSGNLDKAINHNHKSILHRLINNTVPRVINNHRIQLVINSQYTSSLKAEIKAHYRISVTTKILSDELLKTANELDWTEEELSILSSYTIPGVKFTDNWTFTTAGNFPGTLAISADGVIFYFKGEPVKFIIENDESNESSDTEFLLFTHSVVNMLINTLISITKTYFTNNKENKKWLILS